MSSTGSSRPLGFTSPISNRRNPMRNSNTSVQGRELLFESIPRTSARTIQSIRRRLGMIGIERDRSLHDLSTSVQNLALEPSSTLSRSAMDRRTQELIRILNSRDVVEAALISALQKAHAQPSPTRPWNDSQLIHREGFAPYPAGSGPNPSDEESGSQPTPHTLRNHQQSMARTRLMPFQTRIGSPPMLFPDPQSTPLREGFTPEEDRQMNDSSKASQRAESSPKFGGNLRAYQSRKVSPILYGTQRSATQGPAKEAESEISTATTEGEWEVVNPSRGNGFTTGTLKRIDELRAHRQKTFEEYMEETAEWLDLADEKLDKYRSKSEAFREYPKSRPYRRAKRTADDNINRSAQRWCPTEENVVHAAHWGAELSSKDTCLYCFNDKSEGCSGR